VKQQNQLKSRKMPAPIKGEIHWHSPCKVNGKGRSKYNRCINPAQFAGHKRNKLVAGKL
jgi:hypothetical protein